MVEAAEVLMEKVEYMPAENWQGQLGDDADPPEIDKDQWPFLSSCDDREHFGGGPSFWITKKGVVVLISELRPTLTGVLIGQKTGYGRIKWTTYRRVDLPFKKAISDLREWQAQSKSLDLGRAA